MITDLLFATTLGLGQMPAPAYPSPMPAYTFPGQAGTVIPVQQPGMLPSALPTRTYQTQPGTPEQPPATIGGVPAQAGTEPVPAEEPKADEPAKPEPGFLMKTLSGTWIGERMEERRISASGWIEGSYSPSTNSVSNAPVTWNDRANQFLLNQLWLRLERAVDTESKDVSFGWRVDTLYGTDYRFTLPRGLWNSQLLSSSGKQNLYGVDLIQFYANAYIPDWFQGTDVRAGRLFTPFGYESLEGVSTPFVSRSYAFNFCPPFTHMGIQVAPTFNDNWSGKFMFANGNDVFIGDPSQEARFVGAITHTSDDKNTVQTFGTSIGRGKFDAGDPFNPATAGLMSEPAGRNNINVFDYVLSRKFNDKASYAFEAIYGYQTGVPTNVPGGIIRLDRTSGTAHWGSIVNYLFYNFTDKFTGITRLEFFNDNEGQRTGFEGLYTSVTVGAQWKPTSALMIRPEIRYDINNNSNPFEGRNNIIVIGLDAVVKF